MKPEPSSRESRAETPHHPQPEPSAPKPRAGALRRAKRLVRIVFAFTLILLGFALGFIPGIPGLPLGLAGLVILAAEYVWARKLLDRIKREGARLREVLWPWRRRGGGSGTQPGPVSRE